MSALITHYKPKPGQTFVADVETETAKVRVTRFDGGEVRLNINGTIRQIQMTLDACEAAALRDLLTEATEGIEA